VDHQRAAVGDRAGEHLGVHAPISHRWAASAGYTTTGLPVIAQVRENVWGFGGYSGTGNVIGALSARAVAAAALDHDMTGVQTLLGDSWSPAVTHEPGPAH
jgi:gamma-glutamylputrescine oxidase